MDSEEYKNLVLGLNILNDTEAAPLMMGVDVGSPEKDKYIMHLLEMEKYRTIKKMHIISGKGAGVGRESFINACATIPTLDGEGYPVSWTEVGEQMRELIKNHFCIPTPLLHNPEDLPQTDQAKVLRKMQALNEAENFKDILGKQKMHEMRKKVQQLNKKQINDQLSNYIDMKLGAKK